MGRLRQLPPEWQVGLFFMVGILWVAVIACLLILMPDPSVAQVPSCR